MPKTHRNRNLENINDRCYVVYGSRFNPMKIKGLSEKKALMAKLKKMGFTPKYSLITHKCTRKVTAYR